MGISIDAILEKYIPVDDRKHVQRIIYGMNQGELVQELPVPGKAAALAKEGDFDIQISKFNAGPDERDPRIVRFGVTQNCILEATDAPIQEQYAALEARHEEFVAAAAAAGCNVLCFQ